MPDEDTREEGEGAADEATPDAQPEAQPSPDAQPESQTAPDAGPDEDAASAPESDWPDLDGYREQLRQHAEWSERVGAVQLQLAELQVGLIGIAAQQRALGIVEDLERLNEAVLGGAAVTQSLRLGYGLERYLALFWPAALDPRPDLAQPQNEGEYRVEVYLHLGPDGKGRIRVEGAKRLEAPLPTSRTRLRGVLLGAIQNPKLVEAAAAGGGQPPPAADEQQRRPAADEPSAADRPAAPRPGETDDQPPPEEQVIPLGPSEDSQADSNETESNESA